MSYFEIGVHNPKTEVNYGTLCRSAYQLGASGIFIIGRRFKKWSSDTPKTFRHLLVRTYADFGEFMATRPFNAPLVAIEIGGKPLASFSHPKQAIYLLGAEDNGLPPSILETCDAIVEIESVRTQSFNVAVAGSIIMYDRLARMR